jgi:hypothetical protein
VFVRGDSTTSVYEKINWDSDLYHRYLQYQSLDNGLNKTQSLNLGLPLDKHLVLFQSYGPDSLLVYYDGSAYLD